MRLIISAKPKSRKSLVEVDPADPLHLIVHTPQQPDKGKANEAILKLVAEHLGVPVSSLRLISGKRSRTKIVEASN